MCELLNTEPYLSANVGSGTIQELVEWMQYTNHDGKSPMADWRRENGREKPWKVKYWGVGNEAWGCGGNMTPEYYANIYRQYATFMTDWTNSRGVYRIASGKVQDHNTFDNPEQVKPIGFRQFRRSGNTVEVELPPVSVIVLSVK